MSSWSCPPLERYWSSKTCVAPEPPEELGLQRGQGRLPRQEELGQSAEAVLEVGRPHDGRDVERRSACRLPRSTRSASRPPPRTALNWSAAPCFAVGNSVMAAATMSARPPPGGATAARHQADRLSYIRPRVPSMVSTITVHAGAPPTSTGSSSPSDTTRTSGQCSSNQPDEVVVGDAVDGIDGVGHRLPRHRGHVHAAGGNDEVAHVVAERAEQPAGLFSRGWHGAPPPSRRDRTRWSWTRRPPRGRPGTCSNARRPQRWVQLQVERVVGMVADRSLVHGQHVGQPEAPQGVVASHDVAQDERQRPALVRRRGRRGTSPARRGRTSTS